MKISVLNITKAKQGFNSEDGPIRLAPGQRVDDVSVTDEQHARLTRQPQLYAVSVAPPVVPPPSVPVTPPAPVLITETVTPPGELPVVPQEFADEEEVVVEEDLSSAPAPAPEPAPDQPWSPSRKKK